MPEMQPSVNSAVPIYRNRRTHLRVLVACAAIWAVVSTDTAEADPLLMDDPTITVDVDRPGRLLDSPRMAKIADLVIDSTAWKQGWSRPEAGQILEFYRQVEERTGDGDVWAKVAAAHLRVEARAEKGIVGVLTLPDDQLLVEILGVIGEAVGLPQVTVDEFLNGEVHSIGSGCLCRQGNQLILGDREELVNAAKDRLQPLNKRLSSAKQQKSPLVRTWVNVAHLRQDPNLRKALRTPRTDVGLVAFFGGWLDLVGDAQNLELDISTNSQGLAFDLKLDAGRDAVTAPLAGYFGWTGQNFQGQPLQLPGTMFTTTWARDWSALWEQRAELVTRRTVEKLEEGNEAIRKQLSIFSINVLPSRLVESLGESHYLAIAAADENPYNVDLTEQLPAGVFAVSLKDADAFRKEINPLFRAAYLVAAFGEQKMTRRSTRHEGVNVVSLAFRDDQKSVNSSDLNRYNFMPSWAITDTHFILGSRPQIVKLTIDAFKNDKAKPASANLRRVDASAGSWAAVGSALLKYRPAVRRQLALGQGLPLAEADAELDRVKEILEVLGDWRAETVIESKTTHVRFQLGTDAP